MMVNGGAKDDGGMASAIGGRRGDKSGKAERRGGNEREGWSDGGRQSKNQTNNEAVDAASWHML